MFSPPPVRLAGGRGSGKERRTFGPAEYIAAGIPWPTSPRREVRPAVRCPGLSPDKAFAPTRRGLIPVLAFRPVRDRDACSHEHPRRIGTMPGGLQSRSMCTDTLTQSAFAFHTPCPATGEVCPSASHPRDRSPFQPMSTPTRIPRGAMFCTTCHQTDRPKLHTKGSLGLELLLWVAGVLAALTVVGLVLLVVPLAYSIWRLTSRGKVCRHCQSSELIPPTSPRARQLAAQ